MRKEKRQLDGHKLREVYTAALPAWQSAFKLYVELDVKRAIAVQAADLVVCDAVERCPISSQEEAQTVQDSFFVAARDGLKNGGQKMPVKDFLQKVAEQSAENLVRAGMKTRVFCQAPSCKL
ncbi:MAG TPA: hypothetical protein DD400_05275 [Rhodospirillaceae bacterium]|nr:hypothetical protein [Rhodospirillaceae bacterium]